MRCFVAIELSDEIRRQLGAIQRKHASLGRAVRWVKPEQIHLTLKFLGEIPEADVPGACEIVRAVAAGHAPVEFSVGGAGCFPPGGSARVLWVGLDEPTGALGRLRDAFEEAFEALGVARERRAFSPHLTLARVNDSRASAAVRDIARGEAGFSAGRQRAGEVVLFQSILAQSGATYVPLARAPLGSPAPA